LSHEKIILFFFACPICAISQKQIEFKKGGTFIIGSICRDGIVMGSDSRGVWFGQNNKIAAYTESAQKIFQYNNVVFGMAGLFSFTESNLTFLGLLDKFKKQNTMIVDATSFYSIFMAFAQHTLTKTEYSKFIKNQFIIAGYVNSTPVIFFIENNIQESVYGIGYKTNERLDNKGEMASIMMNILNKSSMSETVDFTYKILTIILKERNKDSISKVGGSPSIVSLDNKGIHLIMNNKFEKYISLKEDFQAVLAKKNKYTFLSKKDSTLLMNGAFNYVHTH